MKNGKKILSNAVVFLFALISINASAVTMLIGDVDSFGYIGLGSYQNAHGEAIDTNGDGILTDGEFLPDLDRNGTTQVNGFDEFDHRSYSERNGGNGVNFTDVSLEDNFAEFGLWPTDSVLFTFDFDVPEMGDYDYGADHFVNFIFGDYDVHPASASIEGSIIPLVSQPMDSDGLVQHVYATIKWEDMLDGEVFIDLIAPNEPYMAIDYAYLHTVATEAPETPRMSSVPEPTALALFGIGLIGMLGYRKKSK